MELSLISINFLAVALAAIVGVFGLGGLWYSPMLFGNIWNREAGLGEKLKKQGHPALVYGASLVMGLISAAAFAIYVGEKPSLGFAITAGFFVGATFVATSFAINYSFGGRSVKLFAIDAGYHILQFMAYGLIIGLWH